MTENRILKLMIISVALLVLGAFLGFTKSYTGLRWDVMLLSGLLVLISWDTRRYYWMGAFALFTLIFNPFHPATLSRFEWQIADISLITLLVIWFWDYFAGYHKGLLFEQLIANKFPKDEWDIVSSTMDLHKKLKRFVEADANPDFIFRKRATGKLVAVECKYRSDYIRGKLGGRGLWWRKEQGERYAHYETKNNIVTLIAFGVGGNPQNPKNIAYIPISIIQKQYPKFIPKEVIEKHSEIPA